MAAKAVQDLVGAREHLVRSISVADDVGLAPAVAAEIRASLAPVLWYLGDTPAALREIALAAPHVTGAVAARLEMHRQLFISPRTVEWHLHKAFTKLGATCRR